MAKSPAPSLDKLKCPNCGHQIPLSEVLTHDIAERTRAEMKDEMVQLQAHITRREAALKAQEEEIAATVSQRVAAAVAAAEEKAQTAANEASAAALRAAQEEAERAKSALRTSQANELALRNKASELEDRAANLDLEVARRIDEEKRALLEKASSRFEEENRLKNAAREKQLTDAMSTIETLQRRLEQGSQQLQGEILELEIEKSLRENFPLDEIVPVPKGVNGADVLHNVLRRSGGVAGSILWELKRTQNFNAAWPAKLKADLRTAKADIAILVTSTLPKEISSFGLVDGVWVCSLAHHTALAHALRIQIAEIDHVRNANVGKKEKAELIYDYLSGPGFKQRVEAIVEAFTEMQSDIAEERRVAERRWAKREKQVAQVIGSTAGMYGDLQGMISLTTIPQLEHKVD